MADTGVLLAFINALKGGGGTGDITDVQINGTSIVSGGVANVPVATGATPGVIIVGTGLSLGSSGILRPNGGSATDRKAGTNTYIPTVMSTQHESTFYGLAKAAGADMKDIVSTTVGIYPAAQKSAISTMLTAPVTITGSTPTIAALPGVRYICGECSTLDITTPASGIVDVVFESGSTPTVLTVTPPTGMTMKWPAWFDATTLEANKTYEINILDGIYGTVTSWT